MVTAAVESVNANMFATGGGGGVSSAYRGVSRHRCVGKGVVCVYTLTHTHTSYTHHTHDTHSTPTTHTSHRLTQRWEASLWLDGKQLYLGGFNSEQDAARAYDIAAIMCKGLCVGGCGGCGGWGGRCVGGGVGIVSHSGCTRT